MLTISFFSLFVAAILMQLSSGGVGPLDALSGVIHGFSTQQIGLIGSSHFVGFFLGCWIAPRLIGIVGHSRTYAVFTSVGTIGILCHTLIVDPYAWAVARIMTGFSIAGCFTVIEAWLQAKTTNRTRGRTIGVYRFVDMIGSMCSQMLIAILEPGAYLSYNILAIVGCASLLPLVLTRIKQPPTPAVLKLRPLLAYRISPVAACAVVVSGVTSASFRMIGPIYGQKMGLPADQIGLFLAVFVLGGLISVYPSGWISDRFDRRTILCIFSMLATASCLVTVAVAGSGILAIFAASAFFGIATFPIYSIAAAHANDRVDPTEMVELNSCLLFYFALGAIVSPYLVSAIISVFAPTAMFVFIGSVHVFLLAYAGFRMMRRPASKRREAFIYMPRTSFAVSRLFRRRDGTK